MKKHTTKFRVLAVLLLAVTSLSSCLKDPRAINFAGSPPLVEFPLAGFQANVALLVGPATTTKTTSDIPVVASAGDYNLPVTVNLASPAVLTTPVTFTVAVDNSVFTNATPSATQPKQVTFPLITTTSASYVPLPAADYVLSNASGTIPAGQRTAVVNVLLHGSLITNTVKNYAIRLVITSASVQVSNYNYIVYSICLQ